MKEALKATWSELMEFVKNPTDKRDENQEDSRKGGQLFRLLLLELPIMFGLILLIGGLDEFGLVDLDSHELANMMDSFSVPMLLFLTVLLAPFLEEMIFRFFLTFKRCYPFHLLIYVAALLSSKSKEEVWSSWEASWHRRYKIVIYLSALVFGLVHISNFEVSTEIIVASPLLIAPQVVIGFFLAYLRVRYGLIWSFFLHALHNFLFVGIGLLFGDESAVGFTDLLTFFQ